MKIVMIELSTDQETAIAKLKNLYGAMVDQRTTGLANGATGDIQLRTNYQQVAALQHLKNSIGNYEEEPILANLKSKKGTIEPIVHRYNNQDKKNPSVNRPTGKNTVRTIGICGGFFIPL